MRHIDLDILDSLPSFEPIHARRELERDAMPKPAKARKPWRRVRRLLQED
jgi:hypothetical protein